MKFIRFSYFLLSLFIFIILITSSVRATGDTSCGQCPTCPNGEIRYRSCTQGCTDGCYCDPADCSSGPPIGGGCCDSNGNADAGLCGGDPSAACNGAINAQWNCRACGCIAACDPAGGSNPTATPTPTPNGARRVSGQVLDCSNSNIPVANTQVVVTNQTTGQTISAYTDTNGTFFASNAVRNNDQYTVSIGSIPPAYGNAQVKTTTSGWTWNFCVNPIIGTNPWGDTPLNSTSYSCQRSMQADCNGPDGANHYERCNFCLQACPTSLPAPTTAAPSCSSATTTTISWQAVAGATSYNVRFDDGDNVNNSADEAGGTPNNCGGSADSQIDVCIDGWTGTSMTLNVNPNKQYHWWVHSMNPACNIYGPANFGPNSQCGPDCNNLTGPSTIIIGQSATYSANFSSLLGDLQGKIAGDSNPNPTPANWDWNPGQKNFSQGGSVTPIGSTSTSYTWTPAALGTYTVFCDAWHDGIAECRGNSSVVDGPPRYLCNGSINNVVSATSKQVTVTNPSPWKKLNNSSFISQNSLDNNLPPTVQAFDSSDSTDKVFINGVGGVVSAAGTISVDGNHVGAKVSNYDWNLSGYSFTPNFTPSSIINYIKSRKNYTSNITDLTSETFTHDGIYTISPSISSPITLNNANIFNGKNVVIIASQKLIINTAIFKPTTGSIVFIVNNSSGIEFTDTVDEADGIFITNGTVTFSNNSNKTTGVKIVGNLITQGTLVNNRNSESTGNSKPSIFIDFNPTIYLNLLPYLSTSTYDWRQVQ